MIDFPTSLPDFARRFSTEAACWEYLREARWPEGFVCPRDGLPGKSFITTRGHWVCQKGHHISVTSRTALHKTKQPLTLWFWAAYLMATSTPGISASQLARQLRLNYETAYMMLQRLRAATVNPGREPLHGAIEVDETIIGSRQKGIRGRKLGPNKSLVICAVETRNGHAGRVRLRRIRGATKGEISKFLEKHVSFGTLVVTDGWAAYRQLTGLGYRHKVIKGESSVDVAIQLTHVHRVFSNLKTWLTGTHHGVSGKHLQAYLNEFAFRFNRRRKPMAGFNRLLGIATVVPGPEYRKLYRSGEGNGWIHPNPPENLGRAPTRLF